MLNDIFHEHCLNPDDTLIIVRRDLLAEKNEELALGVMLVHDLSVTQFLVTGLELEEQQ